MSLHMRSSPDPDRGLVHSIAALERTALAWERTAISLAALGALLLKLTGGGPVMRASGIGLVAGALVMVLVVIPLGYRRVRSGIDPQVLDDTFDEENRLRRRVLLATALLVTITCAGVITELVWTAVLHL